MSQAAGSQPATDQGVSLPRYLVVHGRDGLALYWDWPQAALKVQGYPNAIFKKYRTGEEARDAYNRARDVIAAQGAVTPALTPVLMASLRPPPAYSAISPGASPSFAPTAGSVHAPAPSSTQSPTPVSSAPTPALAPAPAPASRDANAHNDLIAAMQPYDTLSDIGVSDDEDTESLFALETASAISVPETEIDESEANVEVADAAGEEDTSRVQVLPEPDAPAVPDAVADGIAAVAIAAVRNQALHASRRPFPTVEPLLRAAVEASLTSDSVPDPALRARYIQMQAKMLADVLFSGQAYYVIIRGREPGVLRTTWSGARWHLDNVPDSYYQAFHTGARARRWWREHRSEVVDYGPLGAVSPLDNHDPNGPVPTAGN